MLGSIALYVANRAAAGAVGSVTRWASWSVAAILFATLAVAFAAVSAFTYLEIDYGAPLAGAMIAAAALVIALVCLAIPAILDALDRQFAKRALKKDGVVVTTVDAVNKETEAAVDYFGPLQVVSAAFLVGLRAGRSVRGAN